MFRAIRRKFVYWIRLYRVRRKWKKLNAHNQTKPIGVFDINNVSVGKMTYGAIDVGNDTDNKLKIGHYCSIADNVKFLVGLEHSISHIFTYPVKTKILGQNSESTSKGDIVVGDDVWIGYGAIILSGVTIGQGAVIAAGAVVSEDVPPYAVVGGVPAKVIKYRFSRSVIERLLKIDFNKIDKDFLLQHINEIYKAVNEDTDLSWLPQK